MGDRVEGGTGPQTADTAIMASINCVTFNHANYIRTALDSFLMQKTDFAFEILVHDDASTDGTSSIIREYAARYPDQVKPLIQTENQYSQGIDNISGAFNFPRARGKYIFMCDGDDYFLSPDKLQKQVDYMEAHPDCTLCIHSAKIDFGCCGQSVCTRTAVGGNHRQAFGIRHVVYGISGPSGEGAAGLLCGLSCGGYAHPADCGGKWIRVLF